MQKIKLYIVFLLVLAGCTSKKQAPPVSKEAVASDRVVMTDAQVLNAGIETGTVTTQTINTSLKVNGMVDVPPQNIVSVSFPMGGYLRSTKLLPGMLSEPHELLAVDCRGAASQTRSLVSAGLVTQDAKGRHEAGLFHF